MGLIPVKQALELIQQSNVFEIALGGGLIAGTAYHFTCQYPSQRDALPSLYIFLAGELWFISGILLSSNNHAVFGICASYIVFNLIYVTISSDLSHVSLALQYASRPSITCISDIEEFQPNSLSQLQTGLCLCVPNIRHLNSKSSNYTRN